MNQTKFRPSWFTMISNYGHVKEAERLITDVEKTKVKVMSFDFDGVVSFRNFRNSAVKITNLL